MVNIRRAFFDVLAVLFLSVALLMPTATEAQRQDKVFRIGFLTPVAQTAREDVFRDELRRLGYVEGRGVIIEYRSANGNFERLPELAAELLRLNVDVIVARATPAALAARNATTTLPIVMIGVDDPVAAGLIATFARPGGNVTGASVMAADAVGKQFQLLRELLPNLSRVTAVWNPANPAFQKRQVAEAIRVAATLGLRLELAEASSPEELDRVFEAMGKKRTQAVLVLADPLYGTHSPRIAQLSLKHRIPTAYAAKEFAEAGGLLAYGPSYSEAYKVAARHVDRIRNGARPGELPVERSTKFDLLVNAKAAKTLGVAIPQAILLRADQVLD
jgi:putative ABC transport system substrate-binding protein